MKIVRNAYLLTGYCCAKNMSRPGEMSRKTICFMAFQTKTVWCGFAIYKYISFFIYLNLFFTINSAFDMESKVFRRDPKNTSDFFVNQNM